MRLLTTFLMAIGFVNAIFAQDISGQWNGLLKVPGAQLRLVFHFEKNNEAWKGALDSPDQGAKGLPMTAVQFGDSLLHVEMNNLGVVYDGKAKGGKIEGFFKQGGQTFPLALTRDVPEKEVLKRPQDPVKPYPYYSEDVKFENTKAGISLAGTLTLPQKTGKFPAVVLISGSGPQNRDEEVFGHKPFLVLADDLTKKGIAVLRFDDRGTGMSTGSFSSATTRDFASDVNAAVSYLLTRPEIASEQIGLIGHSEGGLIAPMVATERKDVAFVVLLAGPGLPGDEVMAKQSRLIGKANGVPDSLLANSEIVNRKIYAALKKQGSDEDVKKEVVGIIEEAIEKLPASQQPPADKRAFLANQEAGTVATPWARFFVRYDPAPTLSKLKCPVLALNGENDLQVSAKENTQAVKAALEKGRNKHFLVKELPGLNHLFQESKTGSPSEYEKIEQTFSPVAMKEISDWVLVQIKR